MTSDSFTEIPPEVIQAAHVVSKYFAELGSARWALAGVCSRNFESEAFALRIELEKLQKIIGQALRQNDPATTPSFQYGSIRNPKQDYRLPKDGYAPGEYLCACRVCGTHYMGDKRSHACAECAYDPKPAQEEK